MRAFVIAAALLLLAFGGGVIAWRVDNACKTAPAPEIRHQDELEVLRQERADYERTLPMRLSGRTLAMKGYDAGVAR